MGIEARKGPWERKQSTVSSQPTHTSVHLRHLLPKGPGGMILPENLPEKFLQVNVTTGKPRPLARALRPSMQAPQTLLASHRKFNRSLVKQSSKSNAYSHYPQPHPTNLVSAKRPNPTKAKGLSVMGQQHQAGGCHQLQAKIPAEAVRLLRCRLPAKPRSK